MDNALFGTAWRIDRPDAEPVYCPSVNDDKPGQEAEIEPGGALQIEWTEPRDVSTVTIRGSKLPEADRVQVQYWHRIWPDGGTGGWQRLDDPFNGQWIAAKTKASAEPGALVFALLPLDKQENPKIEHEGVLYRRTYKVRLLFSSGASVSAVETTNQSAVWKEAKLKLEWKPRAGKPVAWNGKVEARNGELLSVEPAGKGEGPVTVSVRYSDTPERLSADRGFVVFRTEGWESFSVYVDDVVREGGVYVRDIDAFVSDAAKNLSYATWEGPSGKWDTTVMEKIATLPEQSLEQVTKAIPAKAPREAHLGLPNMRQEFTIDPSGDIMLFKRSLRAPGRDLDRRPWDIWSLHYAVSTLEQPVFSEGGGRKVTRSLREGYMPIIDTAWETGGIAYAQSAFATMLSGGIGDEDSRRGDEPLVLLDRIEMANTGSQAATAHIWMEFAIKRPMSIRPDGLLVLDAPSDGTPREGLTPIRGRFDVNGKGTLEYVSQCAPAAPGSPDPDLKESAEPRPAVHYSVELGPGERHVVYLNVPYIELLDGTELEALMRARFEERLPEFTDYWRKRLDAGMKYDVPEPVLNDLFRANLWHVLITTDRDPITGLHEHGAATMDYYIYANETGMVSESMEMRGEHTEAWRMIEPFLVCQGKRPLPGNFQGKEGLFYSAHPDPENDPYTAQGYNMHHGWALWNLCRHYLWTRDADYLKSAAPKLIAGCDWITRERQATKVTNPDGSKPVEWGLAPAGDLEDVEEYLYWYATNAYHYIGMKTCADVLVEIGHPEAGRIARDAEAYRADILASIRESMAASPVVRLKDGTYVPYVPPRTHVLTHLKEGWIREGLYPALHLLDGELVEPHHPLIEWMLQDLEDNIFMSKESGYGVDDQEAGFFCLGGFNLQPNLLPNSIAHLRRDEVPHFIRVFYNTFWASFYPDTVCFAEWVPHYGKGGGPLYKTPDEAKFVQYMRDMLIFEDGDTLKLGLAVPRKWMEDGKRIRVEKAATLFGQMDMEIASQTKNGRISAALNLPSRNPARKVFLRLRHPDGKPMTGVTVNGNPWEQFDAKKELVTLPKETDKIEIIARY